MAHTTTSSPTKTPYLLLVLLAIMLSSCFAAIPIIIAASMQDDGMAVTYEVPKSADQTWEAALRLARQPERNLTIAEIKPDKRYMLLKRGDESADIQIVDINSSRCQVVITTKTPGHDEMIERSMAVRGATTLCQELGIECTLVKP